MHNSMNRKIVLVGALLLVCTILSVYKLREKRLNEASIALENVAGSYTDYTSESYLDWSVGGIMFYDYYRYDYSTSSSTVRDYTNKNYVYSYTGPSPLTYSVSMTTGTSRDTSVSAEAKYKIFKLAASHSVSSSKSNTVTLTYTFPGDKRKHTLYQKDHVIIKDGSISRTAYRKTVSSFKYIWGVYAWNIQYTGYNRYSARDYSKSKCCQTVEHQYSSEMS